MDFDAEGNSERFVMEMASIIRRIKRLHAIHQQGHSSESLAERDGPWMRVHALLMALHEQVTGAADDEALSSLMRKVDRELSEIESSIEAPPSFQPCGFLH